MQFTEFKKKYQHFPVIFSRDILSSAKNRQAFLNQLKRWQNKGLVIKLKRGLYLLQKEERKVEPSYFFIANQLYSPSYVSLEYALHFYGLIPERVNTVTSATTKKTTRFKNETGIYTYQHLKPVAFRGFKAMKETNDLNYFIAEPEKAVVDFLYFYARREKKLKKDVFEKSFRFQNVESLRQSAILKFARLFGSRKLMELCRLFCEYVKEGKKNK